MKSIRLALVTLGLSVFVLNASAKVAVFFVGGQSNATIPFKEGIESALKASGRYDEVLVVQANRGGTPSYFWRERDPNALYQKHFFSPAGDGVLQQALAGLKTAGKEYEFAGFFWFQGEASADRAKPGEWRANLLGLVGCMDRDLGASNWRYVVVAIDGNLAAATKPNEASGLEELRAMMKDLAGADPRCLLVDSRGYRRTDLWHLAEDESRRLGRAAGETFLAARR